MSSKESTPIRHLAILCARPAAAGLLLSAAAATGMPSSAPEPSGVGKPPAMTLDAYRTLAAARARDYDRAQDISPRQLVLLLEVAERTGTSLGQLIATGEHESAKTWNDHVRPTLKSGALGSATGVWQFLPGTFHSIIKRFGSQLLAASGSDPAAGRARIDLGDGPFTDSQVRALIAEAVSGARGAEDEALQLLRHNFAVLAFAKHYLSVDTGATTPEEDYLFHFLGAGEGRRILALARGEARYTLCVRQAPPPALPADGPPDLSTRDGAVALLSAGATLAPPPPVLMRPAIAVQSLTEADRLPQTAVPRRPGKRSEQRPGHGGEPLAGPVPRGGGRITAILSTTVPGVTPLTPAGAQALLELPAVPMVPPEAPPPVSSEWGLPADSPTVTGNLGMFYRDGKGQSQPYTWGEFMANLARRVRAESQPELVRAKYGVGFQLKGGDMPHWAFDPGVMTAAAEFRHLNGLRVVLPAALITGPLDRDETRDFKQRLAALVSQSEDRPLEVLPPALLAALHHLRMLPPTVVETRTTHPEVAKALDRFRKAVGKAPPDDPARASLLWPAERVALEVYARRLDRYAGLQAGQEASLATAPDLIRIKKMPAGLQKTAAPHLAPVQTALAAQGLLTPPTVKTVWRDKKHRKQVAYRTAPFSGRPDPMTVTALNSFQWRHGLRRTEGVLDAVTLKLLGLPPLGTEIFAPLAGPECALGRTGVAEPLPRCEGPGQVRGPDPRGRLSRRAGRPVALPLSETL